MISIDLDKLASIPIGKTLPYLSFIAVLLPVLVAFESKVGESRGFVAPALALLSSLCHEFWGSCIMFLIFYPGPAHLVDNPILSYVLLFVLVATLDFFTRGAYVNSAVIVAYWVRGEVTLSEAVAKICGHALAAPLMFRCLHAISVDDEHWGRQAGPNLTSLREDSVTEFVLSAVLVFTICALGDRLAPFTAAAAVAAVFVALVLLRPSACMNPLVAWAWLEFNAPLQYSLVHNEFVVAYVLAPCLGAALAGSLTALLPLPLSKASVEGVSATEAKATSATVTATAVVDKPKSPRRRQQAESSTEEAKSPEMARSSSGMTLRRRSGSKSRK